MDNLGNQTNPNPQQNKKYNLKKIFIFIIISILVVICGYYSWITLKEINSSPKQDITFYGNADKQINMSYKDKYEWIKYQNKYSLGITFEYPKNWVLSEKFSNKNEESVVLEGENGVIKFVYGNSYIDSYCYQLGEKHKLHFKETTIDECKITDNVTNLTQIVTTKDSEVLVPYVDPEKRFYVLIEYENSNDSDRNTINEILSTVIIANKGRELFIDYDVSKEETKLRQNINISNFVFRESERDDGYYTDPQKYDEYMEMSYDEKDFYLSDLILIPGARANIFVERTNFLTFDDYFEYATSTEFGDPIQYYANHFQEEVVDDGIKYAIYRKYEDGSPEDITIVSGIVYIDWPYIYGIHVYYPEIEDYDRYIGDYEKAEKDFIKYIKSLHDK